jgi:hypothetical protein
MGNVFTGTFTFFLSDIVIPVNAFFSNSLSDLSMLADPYLLPQKIALHRPVLFYCISIVFR